MEIKELLTRYEKDLNFKNSSQYTLWVYFKDIRKLTEHFDIKDSSEFEIEPIKLNEFYQSLHSKLLPVSINGLMRSLSAFYNWLKEMNLINQNYNLLLRYVKVPKRKKIVLSDEEAIQLIKGVKDIQVKLMIQLMWITGVRRSAIANLKLSDIQGCYVRFIEKGNKEEIVQLGDRTCTLLNIYLAQRESDSPYLFYATRGKKRENGSIMPKSVNDRVRSAMRKSGLSEEQIKAVTAHRIRGSAGTDVIEKHGLDAGQKFLGHETNRTTQDYNTKTQRMVNNLIAERDEAMSGILEGLGQ